jgi:hypothetical protein
MRINYRHSLKKQDALAKLSTFLDTLAAQAGGKIENLTQKWDENGFTFSARVPTPIPFVKADVKGSFAVEDDLLTGELEFPKLPQALSSQVEKKVTEGLNSCFAKD